MKCKKCGACKLTVNGYCSDCQQVSFQGHTSTKKQCEECKETILSGDLCWTCFEKRMKKRT